MLNPPKPGTHAVALETSLEALRVLLARFERDNIPHVSIVESDEPYSGQLMAIGVVPGPRCLKRYLSSFPLVGKRRE